MAIVLELLNFITSLIYRLSVIYYSCSLNGNWKATANEQTVNGKPLSEINSTVTTFIVHLILNFGAKIMTTGTDD